MMVGLDVERVRQGIAVLNSVLSESTSQQRLVEDYNVPNVSEKVVKIIHSYTSYVRQRVWKEYN